MKELYICVFQKFNFSLQDVNFFDYNRQDESVTNKLQSAYSYYKTQCKDEKIMFMQFCRNLQKFGGEYSSQMNTQQMFAEQREAPKPFVFINIHNLSIMLVQNPAEQLFSFICINSTSGQRAVNEYADVMSAGYGIGIDKDRCAFFGNCNMMIGEGQSTECGVYFYPLTLGEFKIFEGSRSDTVFKNVNDPMLVLSNHFIYVSPFVATINTYIKEMSTLITRKKSESAPMLTSGEVVISGLERDALTDRLKNFELELDGILQKYNLW